MHPGGIADKAGNRYEAIWLIRHLLELIDGRATAVTIELLGADEAGFEFCVDRPSHREWHQCKRQTSSGWTINRLARDGILGTFKRKLADYSDDRCVFVSTDPVKALKRLKEKQPAGRNPVQFERSLSDDEQTQWQVLQQRLELGPEQAFQWLAGCDFVTFPERELTATVHAELERWFDTPADQVMAILRQWIEDDATFNRPLRRAELEAHLRGRPSG